MLVDNTFLEIYVLNFNVGILVFCMKFQIYERILIASKMYWSFLLNILIFWVLISGSTNVLIYSKFSKKALKVPTQATSWSICCWTCSLNGWRNETNMIVDNFLTAILFLNKEAYFKTFLKPQRNFFLFFSK